MSRRPQPSRRRTAISLLAIACFVSALLSTAGSIARADDKVSLGTDWRAEAEHGGYYQALATGIFKKYGLDVTIRQGGPSINHPQLAAAGKVDFYVQSNGFETLNLIESKVPLIAIAAFFQKDPQSLISHPGAGNDTLAQMKGKPVMISAASRPGFWQFLRVKYGFSDEQIRPYNYSLAPFLADKNAIQQGYVTSEAYTIEKATGTKPVVNLLADLGFRSYGAMLATTGKLAAEKPELVQRFVNASIEGWASFMRDDPTPAFTLIKQDNPEMTDDLLVNGVRLLKEYGVVDSGDSKALGIGAMTDARWKEFSDFTIEAGLHGKDLDPKQGYTLKFVNQKVGVKP